MTPALAAEVALDHIPELLGEIERLAGADHLGCGAVVGQENERPLRGFVASPGASSRGALPWRAVLR